MIQTLPITKVREELTGLVEKVNKRLDEYVITVNGTPAAVLMSVDEFEAWKETIDIASDLKLMQDIREGEEDIKQNRMTDWEDLKKEIAWDVPTKNHLKGKITD